MSAPTKSELRQFMKAGKRRPCMDCGVQYPIHCMEYDHRPELGEKLFNLGTVGWWNGSANGNERAGALAPALSLSYADVQAEMDKCDVVCVICHRIRKWGAEL